MISPWKMKFHDCDQTYLHLVRLWMNTSDGFHGTNFVSKTECCFLRCIASLYTATIRKTPWSLNNHYINRIILSVKITDLESGISLLTRYFYHLKFFKTFKLYPCYSRGCKTAKKLELILFFPVLFVFLATFFIFLDLQLWSF